MQPKVPREEIEEDIFFKKRKNEKKTLMLIGQIELINTIPIKILMQAFFTEIENKII